MANKRYYYKKDGKAAYNLKEPLENILDNTDGYEEITETEWNELTDVIVTEPTAEELATQEKLARINELKGLLRATDYQAIKYAEGWISEEDYAETKALRQEYRDEINELEAQL